jgi:hypothetical protein
MAITHPPPPHTHNHTHTHLSMVIPRGKKKRAEDPTPSAKSRCPAFFFCDFVYFMNKAKKK